MADPRSGALPRRLLLATNLTSRCDRALARALALAHAWDAELHVVHVLEAEAPVVPAGIDPGRWRQRCPDPRDEARRQWRRDLGPDAQAILHLETGDDPAGAVLAVCAREHCDLVVVGEGRRRLLGPLEDLTARIARQAPASVLVVRDRCHGPYRRLLVGSDLSDDAGQALAAVATLFPAAQVTLLHAFDPAYAHLRSHDEAALAELDGRLQAQANAVLSGGQRAGLRTRVIAGPPEVVLHRHQLDEEADLVVIGASRRGLVFDAVIGDARRIVAEVAGDVLLVRAGAAGGTG